MCKACQQQQEQRPPGAGGRQLNVPSVSYNVLGSGNLGKDMNFPKTANTGILMYGYAFQQMGVGVQTRVIRIGSKCRYLLSHLTWPTGIC